MAGIFKGLTRVSYKGPQSTNPFAFTFCDPSQAVMGKTMREHLPFVMAWRHTLCATGPDLFGSGTADKGFGAEPGTMAHARAKVDAGLEFMRKLSTEYFLFP